MNKLQIIKFRITIIILFSIFLSLFFGYLYYLLRKFNIDSLNKKNPELIDFYYYSWMNQLTVGYAQFYPTSVIGKLLSMLQIFLFWIVILSLSIIIDEENILKLRLYFI